MTISCTQTSFSSEECVFFRYSTSHKGYLCFSMFGHVYISKDVIFNELCFPYPTLFPSTSPSIPSQYFGSPAPLKRPFLSLLLHRLLFGLLLQPHYLLPLNLCHLLLFPIILILCKHIRKLLPCLVLFLPPYFSHC